MSSGKINSERLGRETQRFLNECREEIRQLELSEAEARRNIRSFLERLPQFKDPPKHRDPRETNR